MILVRRVLGVVVVASAIAIPAIPARAADSRDTTRDPAMARQLLKDGYELVKASRCADAIPLFQKSVELDQQPKAFLNLARCEEQIGRFGEALVHWARARDLAREQVMRAMTGEAESRLQALEGKMPRVTVFLAGEAPRESVVRRDGVLVPMEVLGHPMPLDPGDHTIEVSAEGWETKSVPVHIEASQQLEVVVAPIAPLLLSTPTSTLATTSSEMPPRVLVAKPIATPSAMDLRTPAVSPVSKPLFYGGIGLAITGVVVGATTGAMTLAHGDLRGQCSNGSCPQPVYEQVESARTTGTVATIAFGAAAIGLVASGVGYLLRPSASRTRATVVPAPLGAGAAVSF